MKNKVRTLILLSILLISVTLKAQLVNWSWVTSAGGGAGDYGYSVNTDENSNIITVGLFNNIAFFDQYTIYSPSIYGGFFTSKMDSLGFFQWVQEGYSNSLVLNVASCSDQNNNIYTAGYFKETLVIDTFELISSGHFDPLIAEYSTFGELLWAKQLFGSSEGFASFIEYYNGYLYVSGGFEDSLYSENDTIISVGGYDDVFLAKYDTLGNCMWLKNMVSNNESDAVRSMDLDSEGNIFMTGWFNNTAIFGDTSLTSFGNGDGYILKIDSSGNILRIHQIGGTSQDGGLSIYIDIYGNTYVKGVFNGTATIGDTSLIAIGGINFFLAKFNTNGAFLWARRMLIECNINDDSYFNSISCDVEGNLYMTAWFALTFQFDGISLTSAGEYDSFVMKLSPDGDALWAMQLSSSAHVFSRSITNDNNGNLYITGWFKNTMTYGDSTITPYGGADVFIAKLHEEPVSVSYNEMTATLEISVYPNPATEYVNIGNSEQQIEKAEIIGMSGKIVRTFNSNLNYLDVTGLQNGTYLLKLYEHNIIFVTKIIIQ